MSWVAVQIIHQQRRAIFWITFFLFALVATLIGVFPALIRMYAGAPPLYGGGQPIPHPALTFFSSCRSQSGDVCAGGLPCVYVRHCLLCWTPPRKRHCKNCGRRHSDRKLGLHFVCIMRSHLDFLFSGNMVQDFCLDSQMSLCSVSEGKGIARGSQRST